MGAVAAAEEASLEADFPVVMTVATNHVDRPDLQKTQATQMGNGAVRTGEEGGTIPEALGPGMANQCTRLRCLITLH